jgi:hypothetical protein
VLQLAAQKHFAKKPFGRLSRDDSNDEPENAGM